MKSRKSKQPLYTSLIAICFILVGYTVYANLTRCPEDGFSKRKAEEVANKLMPIHFVGDFFLSSQTFNEDKKEWNFHYVQKSGDCTVDCLVDRCGAFDVVGITAGCKSRP